MIRLIQRAAVTTLARKEVVEVLGQVLIPWTVETLAHFVERGEVPGEYVDCAVALLGKRGELTLVGKPEFLAALRLARPDLYALIATREGEVWLEKALADLAKALLLHHLRPAKGG